MKFMSVLHSQLLFTTILLLTLTLLMCEKHIYFVKLNYKAKIN